MNKKILGLLAVGMLAGPCAANAALVTYTFEGPTFTAGEDTPLLNRAPNAGDPAFRTDFTSSSGIPMQVNAFVPNPLMSGQTLFSFAGATSVLTMVFNTAIDSLTVDFGIQVPGSSLRFTAGGSIFDVAAGDVGGFFQGGTASLLFGSGITTLSIAVLTPTGGGSGFAIDDLVLNTVPEPGTFVLLGLGLAGLWLGRRRQTT